MQTKLTRLAVQIGYVGTLAGIISFLGLVGRYSIEVGYFSKIDVLGSRFFLLNDNKNVFFFIIFLFSFIYSLLTLLLIHLEIWNTPGIVVKQRLE